MTREARFSVSEDVKLRARSAPAGTHRHVVAKAALKLLMRHPLRLVVPDLASFVKVARANIQTSPASLHIGVKYLTGKDRVFDDAEADMALGWLGTFVTKCYGKSTLAKSPHMAESKWKNPDYSTQFDDISVGYVAAGVSGVGTDKSIAAIKAAAGEHECNVATINAMAYQFGVIRLPYSN